MRAPEATREEILVLERRRLRSLVEPDLVVAKAMHSPDYQLVTPGGATYTREEYLDEIASGALSYSVFEPEDETAVAVRVVAGGAALRYVARIVVAFPGGVDDARVWHTDLYERIDGRWQATWSQATRIRSRD